MRRFLWRPVCHWCSLYGWIDWDVCTVTVILSSGCRSFVLPIVRLLVKGAFRWNQLQSAQRLLRLRLRLLWRQGRSWARTEAFLCFQCGRTLTSSEHEAPRNTREAGKYFCAATDVSIRQQKIHKLSRICFADVNPEVNVQIMDSKWLLKPTWG